MRRTLALLSIPMAAVLLVGSLAWYDLLPGGWRLRGWVVPHAERSAREQREHSRARLEAFARENPGVPAGAVVFLGSSTIERFPLEEAFPGAPCVDRGIGNETATELLARLEASRPTAPAGGFVLYAGSLDFRREGAPAAVVRDRVARLLDRLQALQPDRPAALIGLLSERGADAGFVGRWRAVNRALEVLCRERGVAFVTTDRPPLTSPTGSLSEALSDDRLHLDRQGYRQLARWLLAEGGEVSALLSP